MDIEIIHEPFSVSLIGCAGRVEDRRYGEIGKGLMDTLWREIRGREIANRGINHWAYLAADRMFAGVKPVGPVEDLGCLEQIEVCLPRYVRYVHRGPYEELPDVWARLSEQLITAGINQILPCLEIYGHWSDNPNELETTLLIAIKDS